MKKIIVLPIALFCLLAAVSCVHDCTCTVIEQTPVYADSMRVDTFLNVAMQTNGNCSDLSGNDTYTMTSIYTISIDTIISPTGDTTYRPVRDTVTNIVGNITICE